MTWGLVAVAGATVVGGYMTNKSASKAANSAANAQRDASNAQIAEAGYQFDKIQELLSPYSQAGVKALGGQQDLIGLNGADAQKSAVEAINNSPTMQAMTQQGENSILQNASATGGLRGGNVQGALAQFRPQLLSQLIQQQYGNLGGLVSIGQNAAANTGNVQQNSSSQIINALGQQGAANAGAALATGQANARMWSGMAGTTSMLGTLRLMGKI